MLYEPEKTGNLTSLKPALVLVPNGGVKTEWGAITYAYASLFSSILLSWSPL